MTSTNARLIVSGALTFMLTAALAAIATVAVDLAFGAFLPVWIPVDLVVSVVALAVASRLVVRLIGPASTSRRLGLLVLVFWVSGLIGSPLWALLFGSNLLQGVAYAVSFGILIPSDAGPFALGSHWAFGVPSFGVFVVLAAGLLPLSRRLPAGVDPGAHRTSAST